MFKISIIIPCYNVSQYIDRCLTSIVNQTMEIKDLQIICVDDASTDDTWQHLQKWELQYSDNITLIRLDTNSRQGTARNIAMHYVNAPWVTFIDADDWVELDYCEIMYAYADGLQCDVVCCNWKRDDAPNLSFFENRGSKLSYLVIDTIEKRKSLLVNQNMGGNATTKLIRTDLLINNQICFAEKIAYEDHLWTSLIHIYASNVMIIEMDLYHYFLNPSSTVLTKNDTYHLDWITSMLIKWKEWDKRKILALYQPELEFDFLSLGYFSFLRTLILRYDFPPYSLYLLARQITLEHINDYKNNPYIKNKLNDFEQTLLPTLSCQLGRCDFSLLVKNAGIYLHIHG